MARGKYIVIEGNDGTGKSTQVELLAKWLNEQGVETFVTHEPDGPGISSEIRKVIKNGDLERDGETNLLLFTASRHEIWKHADKALKEGKWVLSARNYISTLVYQGYGEEVGLDKIIETTRSFTGDEYIHPDLTIVLGLTDEERTKRIAGRGNLDHKDTFESRDNAFQETLNHGYEEVAAKYDFPLVDATRSIDEIQAEIREIISPVFDT